MHVKLFLGEKKINCMKLKFILRFVLEIEGKTKKVIDLLYRGQILSWSNFNESGLKLIALSCRFRKYIVSYTLHVPILVRGVKVQQPQTIGPHGIYGHWPLTP